MLSDDGKLKANLRRSIQKSNCSNIQWTPHEGSTNFSITVRSSFAFGKEEREGDITRTRTFQARTQPEKLTIFQTLASNVCQALPKYTR